MNLVDDNEVYSQRCPNDNLLLQAVLNSHRKFYGENATYRRILRDCKADPKTLSELPFLHIRNFKLFSFASSNFSRSVISSATSGKSSTFIIDDIGLNERNISTKAIGKKFLGDDNSSLVILNDRKQLFKNAVPASLMAALSLKYLAKKQIFALNNGLDVDSFKYETINRLCSNDNSIIIHGLTWQLLEICNNKKIAEILKNLFMHKRLKFSTSGGWKNNEAIALTYNRLNELLKITFDLKSNLFDFYGMTEHPGIIYPLCKMGYRHVPTWSKVLIRDIKSKRVIFNKEGQIQLLSGLPQGYPGHSILTEDIGIAFEKQCECGLAGDIFQFKRRLHKAESRGCGTLH